MQAFVSYGRLGKCANESAGKRYGTSGTTSGTADRKGACSEAAVRFLRHNPAGQNYLARLTKQHGKGNALTVLAPKLARAVSSMLKRASLFDMDKFFNAERSGAGEPVASRAAYGSSLAIPCWQP